MTNSLLSGDDTTVPALIGIGMNNQLWTRKTLTSNWEHIPNSGAVLGITVMPDGTIVGIGMDHQLWTRKTLTSNWEHIPNSGAVLGITAMPDGTIVGIGMDHQLWTRKTLTSNWEHIPNSGAVLGITVMPDGTIVGIGMNNQLYTRKTLTSNWEHIPNSGAVLGITVMPDGTIVGIGMNNQLWTRKTLTSNWEHIPNSGSVLGIVSYSRVAASASSVANLISGTKIKLKSWKGDYLHRPDSQQGVTTWGTGIGNEWVVELIGDNKIKLKSWKGDYLHRPDSQQGVTTWGTGIGNEWVVELIGDNKIKLKSWKGDYLHRPDSQQGVTTWGTGIGNEWGLEVISTDVVNTKQITGLHNTGVDNNDKVLGDSVADSHYQMTTYPTDTATPAVTSPSSSLAGGWVANTDTSRWIGPKSESATGPVGEYIYKTTFNLPEFSEAAIVGELSADDQITDILINGVSAGNPTPLGAWNTVSKFSISSGFVVGKNTIEFKINNGGGPTGLRIHSITGTYTPVATSSGKIVVNADEWTLSDQGIKAAPDGATFAINVAKYFVGENKGKFHVLSTNFGLTGASLEQTMTKAGHTWTKGMNISINLETLQQYDGIFLGGNPVDNQVLIEYVKNGGKVYLCAGTGQGGAQVEANNWKTFLAAFGLQYQGKYNGIAGNIAVSNPNNPLFAGVKTLYQNNGNSITDLQPDSPLNEIILNSSGQGIIATAEFIKPAPEPRPEPTPEPAPEPTPETPVTDSEEFTITATQGVTISKLLHKGQVKRTQSDEYIEISNTGNSPADISGWKITSAGSSRQVFTFPQGTTLEGGKSFCVYTNEVHPETGGFSFGSKSAIWNDAGDEAKLFDAAGNNVSTLAYGKSNVAGIKKEFKVPGLDLVATYSAINKQMSLGGKVTFTEALSLAIQSFLEDDNEIESPLGLILNDPGSFDLAGDVTKAMATEKVRSYLNEGGVLTLYPTAKRNTAENGETVEENWIFELSLPAMGDTIFWAIVPRAGEKKVYNYGFS
ncbi:lamin tail domain-containing protein [Okeanomitos corallinicola TIOX110]|uniref:Lamin tail domain-containing protein n=1 Tax=Okeanomitos corallinicola TIOX110 TaxID=3133117 RepID=A0ABZ2UMA2_9CYAN